MGTQNQDGADRNLVLPASDVLSDIVTSFCNELDSQKVAQVIKGSENKAKKILIYKFFFFSYLLQLTLPQLIEGVQKNEKLRDLPEKILKALLIMISALNSKTTNSELDVIMRPLLKQRSVASSNRPISNLSKNQQVQGTTTNSQPNTNE